MTDFPSLTFYLYVWSVRHVALMKHALQIFPHCVGHVLLLDGYQLEPKLVFLTFM